MIDGKKNTNENEGQVQEEKSWDNPVNPEGASDKREVEQLIRLKEEADRRKENLTDKPEN